MSSEFRSQPHSLILGKQPLQTLAFQSVKWGATRTSHAGVQDSGQHTGVLGAHQLSSLPVSPFQLLSDPWGLAIFLPSK